MDTRGAANSNPATPTSSWRHVVFNSNPDTCRAIGRPVRMPHQYDGQKEPFGLIFSFAMVPARVQNPAYGHPLPSLNQIVSRRAPESLAIWRLDLDRHPWGTRDGRAWQDPHDGRRARHRNQLHQHRHRARRAGPRLAGLGMHSRGGGAGGHSCALALDRVCPVALSRLALYDPGRPSVREPVPLSICNLGAYV